jgi:hypothetical protein
MPRPMSVQSERPIRRPSSLNQSQLNNNEPDPEPEGEPDDPESE